MVMRFRNLSCWMLPLALALPLTVAGCADFEGLGEAKKIPLTGERKPLFPQGVPGVEFGAAPQQPGNSNIAINPGMMQKNPDGAEEAAEQQAGQQKQKQKQKQATPADKSARTAARGKKSTEEDPWVETR
jgi:hypothetical protein